MKAEDSTERVPRMGTVYRNDNYSNEGHTSNLISKNIGSNIIYTIKLGKDSLLLRLSLSLVIRLLTMTPE